LAIEQYLRYFHATHGLRSTAFRISNPYGPRQHPNRKQGLIPIALRQILEGEPIVRFGSGSMVRDYVYVEDLIEMILPVVSNSAHHDVYNLGSGVGHSVNDVFDALRRVTGVDFDVVSREIPPTFVDRVVLDTTRFRAEFGVTPMTPLDEGVRRTFDDMKAEFHG
jgi:UDP-glucose 4-epimerase